MDSIESKARRSNHCHLIEGSILELRRNAVNSQVDLMALRDGHAGIFDPILKDVLNVDRVVFETLRNPVE